MRAVAGEGLTLGRVYGPDRGQVMPVAVANPIFIDVDGDGFQPNGDLLDYPLPLEATETPVPGHLHHQDHHHGRQALEK